MHFVKTAAAVIVAAILGAVAFTVPAQAAPPARVDLRGANLASYTLDEDGSARFTGDVIGKPFDGTYTAVLTPADGTFPEPDVCEPATATVDITGAKGRYLQMAATGNVCGRWSGTGSSDTHRFIGRYVVVDSSARNTRGTDGWIGLSLITEGRAYIEAFDS